jgi:hypothetical protein
VLESRGSAIVVAVFLVGLAIALLRLLAFLVNQDTWLALVAGRQVAQSGIPHHALTIWPGGGTWIDQPWLSQLSMYWLFRLGGIALVGAMNVAMVVLALAGAAWAAVRLGASARAIARLLPLAVTNVLVAVTVRTQPYAYPLFVATMYLLAKDSRAPSKRVYLCLPVLILWANVHGSASLGAGMVILRGLVLAWQRRAKLKRYPRAWPRPALLVLAPVPVIFVNPYGTGLVSYYHSTLFNSGFRKLVTEWLPVTSSRGWTAAFFIVTAIVVWSLWRYPDRTTLWERCLVVLLAAGAFIAIRNLVWFGLAVAMILPVSLTPRFEERRPAARSRPLLNGALALAAAIGLVAVLAFTFMRSASALVRSDPNRAVRVVRATTFGHPGIRVLADERLADWLLWRLPALRGRVAFDASFELLSASQLTKIVEFKTQSGPNWQGVADGYRLLVLDSRLHPRLASYFERAPGARTLFAGDGVAVVLRSAVSCHCGG